MELLRKIKRLLGIGRTSEEDRSPGETPVTVEREREPEPDAGTEAAVKGEEEEVDAAPEEDSTASTDATEEGAASGDADASGSTETIRDEDEASQRPETAAEPAEAAGPESDDVSTDVDGDADAGGADATADEAETVDAVPVDELKGIGPAYADRLADMGIESVVDLAEADAAEVAERIDVSEKRVSRWIERANEHES